MSNIIAVIWDCDNTLINGYMEDPIFKAYGVDPAAFWKETGALPEKYLREQGVKVNPETIYLNQFIRYAKDGRFGGLNNRKLRHFGKQLTLFKGVPEIFGELKNAVTGRNEYEKHNIRVEHYVVSTGLTEVIRGSVIAGYVEGIWGCEFIEDVDENGNALISEIGYTIDNTTKTRAIFEINKGVGFHDGVGVNTQIPQELRRIPIRNMIYVADGPSDIPAFSVVNQGGGATFAIYPAGNMDAMKQVEQMRKDGRINMFAEADYRKGTTSCMWLTNKVLEIADRIVGEENSRIEPYTRNPGPRHLN